MKYSFTVEIPVIRPSERVIGWLKAEGMRLTEKYRKTNLVAYRDINEVTRLSPSTDYPLTDKGWLAYLRRGMRWDVDGWNFDPGTTARIFLRRGGVGAYYVGRIVFMNGGRRLAFTSLSGGEELPEYYLDMRDLGIYLP